MIRKEDVPGFVKDHDIDVLMILGAGDLDNYMPQLTDILKDR